MHGIVNIYIYIYIYIYMCVCVTYIYGVRRKKYNKKLGKFFFFYVGLTIEISRPDYSN